MTLFELTPDRAFADVPATTFAAEGVWERADLQAAIRDRIDVLGDDLLVVAEEFGDFDVDRRIDLLCVDRAGQLVVVELKRTEDGGHMELQALRYAAMVSAMTFDELAATLGRHLRAVGSPEAGRAREVLAEWLEDVGGEEAALARRVRIVLVSAGFDTHPTTAGSRTDAGAGPDVVAVEVPAVAGVADADRRGAGGRRPGGGRRTSCCSCCWSRPARRPAGRAPGRRRPAPAGRAPSHAG